MAAPSPAAGAKTLGKHKYLAAGIVVVVGAVVYLYFKNRGSTSAGSSSVPGSSPATVTSPGDSTGGGASGPDLSGLFDSLFGLLGEQQQTIQTIAGGGGTQGTGGGSSNGGQSPVTGPSAPSSPVAPVTSTPTPAPDQAISTPAGGGNVVAPVADVQPSQPNTSTPVTTLGLGDNGSGGPTYTTDNAGRLVDLVNTPEPQMMTPQQGTTISYDLTSTNFATDTSNGGGYSPPLVTLAATKPKAKAAPASGYSQKSKANLH